MYLWHLTFHGPGRVLSRRLLKDIPSAVALTKSHAI
jgi:hypothetical protein